MENFPFQLNCWEECQPIYEEMEGWKENTSHLHAYKDLPSRAQLYLRKIEDITGIPIGYLSLNPERTDLIKIRPKI